MQHVEQFKQEAQRARDYAKLARNREDRAFWQRIAEKWERLAAETEQAAINSLREHARRQAPA